MKTVASKLKEIPIPEFDVEEDDFESVKMAGKDFDISVQNNVYSVQGDVILKIIASTNFDDYESLQYFQRVLRTSGVIDQLEQMGINEGDTVVIYDLEFEYKR